MRIITNKVALPILANSCFENMFVILKKCAAGDNISLVKNEMHIKMYVYKNAFDFVQGYLRLKNSYYKIKKFNF